MPISFETVGIVSGAVLSAGAVIAGVYRCVIIPIRNFIREGYNTYEIVQRELRPNRGNSLWDVVTRIDNRLLINEVRGRVMLEHVRMYAYEADQHGLWTFVSRALCQLLNCTPDQLLGHGWRAFIHASCRDCVGAEWDKCVKQGRDYAANYPLSHNPNICLHSEAFVLRDQSGSLHGYVGVITPNSADACPRDCPTCGRNSAAPTSASRIGPNVTLGDPEE